MPDFEQLVKGINAVLQLIFGNNIPSWMSLLIGILLIIGLVLCAVWGGLFLISKITEQWTKNVLPLFYKREEKQRSLRRRYFAEHIESEIVKLGRQEEWKDYRFTELEAEVEAEGRRKIFSFVPFFNRTSSSRRLEKNLSKALASSQERLLLVEGEPGSGKSVALRHVAQKMAAKATKVQSTKSVIPIYVNLKELERQDGVAIDRNLIESFILKSLKRINDRDIDKFLDDEFKLGIENGTWFFLFDSFDELPEVLSSTEADIAIRSYGNAIDDFLHGMNRCRGIVASRQFRGPTYFGWPRFLVLSLSEKRRLELIQKVGLKDELESELIGQLDTASDEIRFMASNPLFLNLLCEHMKSGHIFPKNAYTVFETYIENRLTRDEKSLQRRFRLDISRLRSFAESIAFCMASDAGLGLSPTRENLKEAMNRLYNSKVDDSFETFLDALEFMKLARSEVMVNAVQSKSFTFAHRRFQEYFATCIVLREPERVSSNQLLIDARWRETAVVMCQTQPIQELTEIIEQADKLLSNHCINIPYLIELPLEYIIDKSPNPVDNQLYSKRDDFLWPAGCFHLLSLLQDGFVSRLIDLPEDIRMYASRIVLSAAETGSLSDKKSALEVAGIVHEPVLVYLLRSAFANKSQWLREIAYRQVSRLTNVSSDIAHGIRNALVELAISNRLRREQHATKAHLARINVNSDFLSIMRLLLWLPRLDFWLHVVLLTLLLAGLLRFNVFNLAQFSLLITLVLLSHLSLLVIMSSLLPVLTFWSNTVSLHKKTFLSILQSWLDQIKRPILRLWRHDKATKPSNSSRKRVKLPVLFSKLLLATIQTIFWTIFILIKFSLILFSTLLSPQRDFSGSLVDIFATFVATYVVLFGPLAFWAAVRGGFVRIQWWFILPIWPILLLFRNFKTIYKSFIILLKEDLLSISLLFSLIVIYIVLLSITFKFIDEFIIHNQTLLLILASPFWSIIAIVLIGMGTKKAFEWIHDWLKWHKWIRSHIEPMTCQDLISNLRTYRGALFRIRLLKVVREQRVLIATDETEAILLRIALEAEKRQQTNRYEEKDKPFSQSNLPDSAITKDGTEYIGLETNASPEFLDALYMLLEDIRTIRQHALTHL